MVKKIKLLIFVIMISFFNNQVLGNYEKLAYDFKFKDLDGSDLNLSDYKNKVIVVVNVASRCGNTPQYSELQELQDRYKQQDFIVLGFPCNDFSIVGETKGMDGKFGMLYQYGVKVLNKRKPMAFVAENVSGISGANDGKAWQKITADLEKAGKGYDLYAHHYYFEHYGVPQMRHRYIVVGIRKDLKLNLLRCHLVVLMRWKDG